MGLPIVLNDPISFGSVEELHLKLHSDGCHRCSLGFQPEINGCCVYRGTPSNKRMIIGEAPGREEDSRRSPWTGPAGQLLDKIFAAAGLDTNSFYVGNVIKCRPFSPKGSGRENFTPKTEQQQLCKPFLEEEIRLINPRLIVLMGRVALDNILPELKKEPMSRLRGRTIRKNNIVHFLMYHTAYILHNQPDQAKFEQLKLETWEDIQKLAILIKEENL